LNDNHRINAYIFRTFLVHIIPGPINNELDHVTRQTHAPNTPNAYVYVQRNSVALPMLTGTRNMFASKRTGGRCSFSTRGCRAPLGIPYVRKPNDLNPTIAGAQTSLGRGGETHSKNGRVFVYCDRYIAQCVGSGS
jgi:hypothetical protein